MNFIIIEGYASTFFNQDYQNDIILPGAFTETIDKKPVNDIKLLWQHDYKTPIGTCVKLSQDKHGLFARAIIYKDIKQGFETSFLIENKVINHFSIGYRVKNFHYKGTAGNRYLTDIDLMEISIVTFPANKSACITKLLRP